MLVVILRILGFLVGMLMLFVSIPELTLGTHRLDAGEIFSFVVILSLGIAFADYGIFGKSRVEQLISWLQKNEEETQ